MRSNPKLVRVGSLDVLERDLWRTPRPVFDHFDRIYGFELDAAARGADALCQKWLGPDHPQETMRNAFEWQSWDQPSGGGPVWCNPPYSQKGGGLANWMHQAEMTGHEVATVALVPATPSTRWFERAMETAYEVTFFRQRIAYNKPNGKPSGSARGDTCAFTWIPNTRGQARVLYMDVPTECASLTGQECPF